VPEDAVIGAHWDTVFGLYTKRQTYYLALPIVERYKGVAGDKEIRALFPSLVHYGVNYVAVEPYMVHHDVESPANPLILVMMKQCPKCFERVYLSPRGMIELYRFRYPSLE
jgi:hypothetical protein